MGNHRGAGGRGAYLKDNKDEKSRVAMLVNSFDLALDSDNELREAIIAAADVLKTSDKIVSAVERVVKSIEAGETRLQEVRELNRVKVSGIADVKKEAQALLSMSAKKPKKK